MVFPLSIYIPPPGVGGLLVFAPALFPCIKVFPTISILPFSEVEKRGENGAINCAEVILQQQIIKEIIGIIN